MGIACARINNNSYTIRILLGVTTYIYIYVYQMIRSPPSAGVYGALLILTQYNIRVLDVLFDRTLGRARDV